MIRSWYTYIDRLLWPGKIIIIAGGRTAMAATLCARKVRCYHCQAFGHMRQDCTNSKKERPDAPKLGSLHNWTTQRDANCNTQKEGKDNTEIPRQEEVHSVGTVTGPTPTEEDFGYAFVILGRTLQPDLWENAQTDQGQGNYH